MNHFHSPADVVRKIAFLALIGFGVIVLSGPIIAVLSVVLSFALVLAGFAVIGLLVWVPFRMLTAGRRATVENLRELGRGVGRTALQAGGGVARVLAIPWRLGEQVFGGVVRLTWGTARLAWTTARVLTELSLVTVTGVLAGVAMGLWSGTPGDGFAAGLAFNAAVGGLIGGITGVVLMARERRGGKPRPAPISG